MKKLLEIGNSEKKSNTLFIGKEKCKRKSCSPCK